jgi:hypothetical protein
MAFDGGQHVYGNNERLGRCITGAAGILAGPGRTRHFSGGGFFNPAGRSILDLEPQEGGFKSQTSGGGFAASGTQTHFEFREWRDAIFRPGLCHEHPFVELPDGDRKRRDCERHQSGARRREPSDVSDSTNTATDMATISGPISGGDPITADYNALNEGWCGTARLAWAEFLRRQHNRHKWSAGGDFRMGAAWATYSSSGTNIGNAALIMALIRASTASAYAVRTTRASFMWARERSPPGPSICRMPTRP